MRILLLMLAALILRAGDINGIYLGEDVSSVDVKKIAVQIREDGTVVAFRGALVPLLHDRYGNPVYVRKIELR